MTKMYSFVVRLNGTGNNPEEAWNDAVEGFIQEPGPYDPGDLDNVEEETEEQDEIGTCPVCGEEVEPGNYDECARCGKKVHAECLGERLCLKCEKEAPEEIKNYPEIWPEDK